MLKIAHLADIHVRGLTRHDEYTEVFSRFFRQMTDLKPDLIYIAGDIVHSKTQGISPEMIDFLVWWFRGLADVAPVHVILGNHDGILLNADRQDAITPIITAMADPRITLYKKSGVYSTGHAGFNWAVFSCFDEEGWKSVAPVPGEVNIALFHGPVGGSETDIGWKLEGEVDCSFFDGYDLALLGDIHKQQFLTEDRRIAYAGSCVQQDYGESIDKGFLFWEVKNDGTFEVSFHTVQGKHPFTTVNWQGTVEATTSLLESLPTGSRVKVKSDERILPQDWRRLQRELESTFGTVEVVSHCDLQEQAQKVTTQTEVSKEDLRLADSQYKLLQAHFKDQKIEPEVWQQVREHLKRFSETLAQSDDFPRGTKWSIHKLEFDNTFAFGEGNVINFDKLAGITGIFGRNARGKSSIVGTMVYGLFNGTDRGSIKNLHVVNMRKQHCVVKMTVKVDGELYRIERQTAKHQEKDGSEGALTHLNLFQVDDVGNVIEDQSREQRRVSETLIRAKIGFAEDFLLTSLSAQGEMNNFIKQKNTARKATLTRFLGLDIFDRLADLAREEGKVIQAQLKSATGKDWDALLQEKQAALQDIKARQEEALGEIVAFRTEEQEILVQLQVLKGKVSILPSDLTRQRDTTRQLREQLSVAQTEVDRCTEKALRLDDLLAQTSQEIERVPVEELKRKDKALSSLEKSMVEHKHRHQSEASTLRHQEKSAHQLTEVPCGDAFPTCKFIKDSHLAKTQLSTQRTLVDDLLGNLNQVQRELSELREQQVQDQLKQFTHLCDKLSQGKVEKANLQTKLARAEDKVESLTSAWQNAESALAEMEEKAQAQEGSEALQTQQNAVSRLRVKLQKLDEERLELATKTGKVELLIQGLVREKAKQEEIKRRWRSYDLILQGFSKKGIPLQIITSQLPLINAEIAKILQGVSAFTVELQADLDSNDVDVFLDYGDSRRIIEVAGGMEKMIASLAIRVALINVSCLPKTDMLIIDEGFGTLDDLNVEACSRLLVSLKKWFRHILIITHVDGVKDIVDNVLDITWIGKDAQVVYT